MKLKEKIIHKKQNTKVKNLARLTCENKIMQKRFQLLILKGDKLDVLNKIRHAFLYKKHF